MTLYEILLNTNAQAVLIFLLVFLSVFLYLIQPGFSKTPPGPLRLPIVGSLFSLGVDMRDPLLHMWKQYGDVIGVHLGGRYTVILNGYDVIKEALVEQGDAFLGRPPLHWIDSIAKQQGIVSAGGDLWKTQRRQSHIILRDLGFGKSSIEHKIKEELGYFLDNLAHLNESGPLCPGEPIQYAVANVINNVVFGHRWEYDDPVYEKYVMILNRSFEVLGNGGVMNIFPILEHLPGDLFRFKQLESDVNYMMNQRATEIEYHNETLDVDDPQDFIDHYLIKMRKEQQINPDTTYTKPQLLFIIGDLFGAGTETTSTTIKWAMAYMIHYPDVQVRVQEEIESVLGSRPPNYEDRHIMPYTEACIAEIQRLSDVVPLSVPHMTVEDVYLRGYFIPQGTMILPNLYSVHRDEKVWKEPFTFDPSRFLDSDGNVVGRDKLMPFGIGRRVCLGEALARMELFLMFTSLLQRFTIVNPPGEQLPNLTGKLSITNMPKPFYIRLEANKFIAHS